VCVLFTLLCVCIIVCVNVCGLLPTIYSFIGCVLLCVQWLSNVCENNDTMTIIVCIFIKYCVLLMILCVHCVMAINVTIRVCVIIDCISIIQCLFYVLLFNIVCVNIVCLLSVSIVCVFYSPIERDLPPVLKKHSVHSFLFDDAIKVRYFDDWCIVTLSQIPDDDVIYDLLNDTVFIVRILILSVSIFWYSMMTRGGAIRYSMMTHSTDIHYWWYDRSIYSILSACLPFILMMMLLIFWWWHSIHCWHCWWCYSDDGILVKCIIIIIVYY